MVKPFEWNFNSTILHFLPEKILHLPHKQTLVVADWHLGKITHFRKNGIFVPAISHQTEYQKIKKLIKEFDIQKVILLGDLFHSEINQDWNDFEDFLREHSSVQFILTKGNHDVLAEQFYRQPNLQVYPFYQIDDLIFSHQKNEVQSHQLNIIGHHHPGIRIRGKARQTYSLPCFIVEDQCLILPAFGSTTGLFYFKKEENNQIYLVLGSEIVEYNP